IVVSALGCSVRNQGSPEHLVDLTHTLSPKFPYIPIRDLTFPIRITEIGNFAQHGVYSNKWELTEHNGTHIDAPNHFAKDARGLDKIDARELFVPAAVIDFRKQTATSPDALLSVEDIQSWEKAHGRLPAHAAVLLWTGWEGRVGSQERFVNADAE